MYVSDQFLGNPCFSIWISFFSFSTSDFNKSFADYEKKYSDLKKIDDNAVNDLSVFLDSTKFTIGLRQQQKIPKNIALFLAGCKSDHRDLSLYFW